MNKELEIFQDKDGNVYNIETELEHKLILCIVEQQEKLDKIKEYIQSLGTQDGMIKDYMIDKNIKETILELLEEIE